MIKIYHNPRCKKSREGLEYLKTKTSDFETVNYLSDYPFTEASLTSILKKLNMKPDEMLRKQEKDFKEKIKGKDLSDKELIKEMVNNPKLINRPIIETDKKAVWANPPENIDKIL